MRKIFTLPGLLLAGAISAQCPFTPTISPNAPILCPGETVELSTQEYDGYQWFKEGQAIPGADSPILMVDYFNDSGSSFSLQATLDGCTEMSASMLVDGWVFLPPFVIHEGDEPISTGPFGEPTYCEGADVQLTLGMPYTESIQWTLNGMPIPGANSPTLVVTEAGSYSVSGAPAVCPNSVSPLGLTIDVAFMPPIHPVISANDDMLCAFPQGEFYQWYFNGEAVPGSDAACINATQAGLWTVYVDYGHGCQVISEPYLTVGLGEMMAMRPWSLYPNPSIGLVTVAWYGDIPPGTYWSVQDIAGRQLRGGFMPLNGMLQLDLGELPHGTYLFQAAHSYKALGPATRFTIIR